MEQNIQQNPVYPEAQARPEGTPRPMMTFIEAVKTCFSKYAVFSGRARRSEYWWFNLFTTIVFLVLFLPMIVFGLLDKGNITDVNAASGGISGFMVIWAILGLIGMIFLCIVLIPSISVQVRRLHDIGRSGWWFGWCFIVSAITAIVPFFIFGYDKAADMSEVETITQAFSVSLIPGLIMLILSIAEWALSITVFIFSLFDSHKGKNKYGPSPKYQ